LPFHHHERWVSHALIGWQGGPRTCLTTSLALAALTISPPRRRIVVGSAMGCSFWHLLFDCGNLALYWLPLSTGPLTGTCSQPHVHPQPHQRNYSFGSLPSAQRHFFGSLGRSTSKTVSPPEPCSFAIHSCVTPLVTSTLPFPLGTK